MVANAATAPTVQLGEEFKSVAALDGKTFAIVNQAEGKALFGPNNQNLGYDVYSNAFVATNSGYLWKLVSLADNADEEIRGYYLLQLVTPAGADYNCWGMGGVLNSQPTTGSVSFILGLNGAQMGQDIKNGAVYDVQYVEGQGFSLKNIGTGLYQGANTAPAKNEEPTYWSFFKQVIVDYSAAVAEVLAEAEPYKALVTDQKALDAFADAVKNLTSETAKSSEDLEKAKAAVAALIKAQTADGANMTGAIVNPSFELGNANGWTYAASQDHGAKENGDATYTMSNNDGKYVFNIWPTGNAISQTIEGLPNGTYKLQAVIATDGGKKVQLNANDKNVQIDATGKETGVEGEVEFEVTDGKATIGAEGVDESWYKVDNFRLTLVKAAAVVPEKDAWYYAIRVTDKWKEGGADKNKQADFNAEGGYVEIVTKSNANTYDNQVFFQIADAAPEGKLSKNDKVVLKFKAMAILDAESTLEQTEIQAGGGFHKSYDGAGWMPISNQAGSVTIKIGEWTEIEKEITVLDDLVTNFSLDLSYDSKPITYRFDDVSFEYVKGTDDWYQNNKIYAKDFTKGDEVYENGTVFPAAPFKDGAVQVVSDANAEVDHGSQIFFEIPESLRGGEVELTMKVKASKEISVATALHSSADGNGWSGNPAGDKVDFKVGEWTEITRVLNTDCKDGKDNPIAYYVLNLSDKVGKEAITYQFDDLSIKKYYAPVEWGDLVEVPVEGTLVTEKDWTQETSFPYWSVNPLPEGCTRTIENGLVIENTKTDGDPWANQMFTLDGLTLEEGKEYVLRYTLKINGEGDIRADVGPWGKNLVKAPDTQTLENGYRQVVFGIGPCEQEYTGAHAIWQSRKFLGKIIIEKVELFDITPDYAAKDWSDNIVPNGDLATDDMSAFILKNNDVENPEMLLAEKSAIGDSGDSFEIGIETAARPTDGEGQMGGNDYDAQFFVRLPYVLPQGTLFNLEFDLYAEKPNTLAIQAHGEPGQYKGNLSSVTTDPKGSGIVHYQKYLSAPADMRSIAFNLAVADATTYGFSNIKVQIVNDDKATIEEATATADATTLWAETLALNEACYAGRIAETEGCTEASVKALTDAIAAGKAALAPAEGDPAPTKESLTAAAKAITDAIAGLKKDAPALADTDLTKEMFFTWTAVDATAEKTTQAGCDYNVGTSTGMPYGDGTVNEYNYADLSAYDHLAITATEGEPRLLFNRAAQDDHQGPLSVELPRDYGQNKYEAVVDNGDGSKTYVINLKAIVEKDGYAHLHAIKANGWGSTTTVTEMKLFVGESKYTDVLTGIADVETAGAVKDGKYFINGQIVIVKNGVKYNAAGVAIK